MAKYDWNTFRNYVAFLADEMASGTMHPHHDSELISWYHDAFLPWDHYLNNIVLFYHDSPITRSHFMDPTDRAIKGFYCIANFTMSLAGDWRRQAIIWTNAGILLIGPLGTNFSEILIEIHKFPFKKMHLKTASAKWWPFCLGLNVLI